VAQGVLLDVELRCRVTPPLGSWPPLCSFVIGMWEVTLFKAATRVVKRMVCEGLPILF